MILQKFYSPPGFSRDQFETVQSWAVQTFRINKLTHALFEALFYKKKNCHKTLNSVILNRSKSKQGKTALFK